MKKLFLFAIALAFVALAAAPAMAIHKGAGGLVCGQCHTIHNSQGSTSTGDGNGSLGGTAGGSLILHAGPSVCSNFCLNCHSSDGGNSTTTFAPHSQVAPKVLNTTGWTQNDGFSKIGAGGNFYWEVGTSPWDSGTNALVANLSDAQSALGYGHAMTTASIVPPGGDTSLTSGLTCCNCHDPHGTDTFNNSLVNYFRNLRMIPTESGGSGIDLNAGTSLVSGSNQAYGYKGAISVEAATTSSKFVPANDTGGNARIWPLSDGTPASNSDSNQYGDTDGSSGIAAWCAQCHDRWHEANQTSNKSGADWKRHPVAYIIDSADTGCGGNSTIDWGNYTSVGADQRLPAAQGNGYQAGNESYADADAEDRVFCLTCHFAHGGPYLDALRWNYLSAVAQGAQTGNALTANTIGCQQCHNK